MPMLKMLQIFGLLLLTVCWQIGLCAAKEGRQISVGDNVCFMMEGSNNGWCGKVIAKRGKNIQVQLSSVTAHMTPLPALQPQVCTEDKIIDLGNRGDLIWVDSEQCVSKVLK